MRLPQAGEEASVEGARWHESMIRAPGPIRGGSGLMCPMVDAARIEQGRQDELRHGILCPWRHRGFTRRSRKAYRSHWLRHHWRPFFEGTQAVVRREIPWSARDADVAGDIRAVLAQDSSWSGL